MPSFKFLLIPDFIAVHAMYIKCVFSSCYFFLWIREKRIELSWILNILWSPLRVQYLWLLLQNIKWRSWKICEKKSISKQETMYKCFLAIRHFLNSFVWFYYGSLRFQFNICPIEKCNKIYFCYSFLSEQYYIICKFLQIVEY